MDEVTWISARSKPSVLTGGNIFRACVFFKKKKMVLFVVEVDRIGSTAVTARESHWGDIHNKEILANK